MKFSLLAFAFLGMTFCHSVPVKYHAPDTSAVTATDQRRTQHELAAQQRAQKASEHIKAAHESETKATVDIDAARAQGDALYKVTPVELQPMVDALNKKIGEVSADNDNTGKELTAAEAANAELKKELDAANTEGVTMRQQLVVLRKEGDTLAAQASAESEEKSKYKNRLDTEHAKSFIHTLVTIILLVIVAGIAFMWFTGKLGLAAAKVASKL